MLSPEPGASMRRREFLGALGGAAAWPLAARAQQGERVRRIGVLLPAAADDAEYQARLAAFHAGTGSNWAGPSAAMCGSTSAGLRPMPPRIRKHAAELAALAPDVILAASSPVMTALQQATRTVPIVFVQVIDPVGADLVDSLARPGGNATGFTIFEYGMSAKWLELLKQIAPGVTRAAVFRDRRLNCRGRPIRRNPGCGAVGRGGVERRSTYATQPEIERAVTAFARSGNGGLIVTGSAGAQLHRDLIITLAARAQAAGSLLQPLLRRQRAV